MSEVIIDYMGALFPSEPTTHQRIDVLKQKHPALWSQVHTKTIVEPHTHPPNSWLSMVLCEGVLAAHNGGTANLAIFTRAMREYDFPTYYVSQRLLEGAMRTHPPANKAWEHISFPFPAMVFMLPKDALKHPTRDYSITMIGIAKQMSSVGERACVFYPACEVGISDQCAIPLTEYLEPSPGWMQEHTPKEVLGIVDNNASVYMFALAANLLLVMKNRRDLIQLGEKPTNRKPPKHGHKPQVSPTWLGLHYQIQYEEGTDREPSGRFTEIGWRCGHWKDQRYGPGRKDVKEIWIEPYRAHIRGLEPIAS